MFDFEKLEVYQTIRELNFQVFHFLNASKQLDDFIKDQWKRATLSIILNLAEGTGRVSTKDKRHFITMARGSVNESVALLQGVLDSGEIAEEKYKAFYEKYEQISKMLLGMYRSYDN